MSRRLPRLLPLVGVAVGGVLALKALGEVDALPQAIAGAKAFAQEAAKAAPKTAAAPAKPAAPPTASPAAGPQLAKVCAPSAADLAKEAGLSPAELQVLQSLGQRRTQLDAREQAIDTQLQLLAAAEAKLDGKIKAMNGLKGEIQGLLGQADQKQSAEIDRLVTVYSKMKPRDAAPVIAQLDDKVRLPVAAKMKEAALAAILSQMPPVEAKRLTESLAHRFDKTRDLAEAVNNPQAAPDPLAEPPPPEPKAAPARPRRKAALKAPAAKAAAPAVTPASAPASAPVAAATKPAV